MHEVVCAGSYALHHYMNDPTDPEKKRALDEIEENMRHRVTT